MNKQATHSDLLDRIEAIEAFERHSSSATGTLNRDAARFILQVSKQFSRSHLPGGTSAASLAGNESSDQQRQVPLGSRDLADDAILRALLAAFPDRLARRREPGSRKGVMVGGRGVKLAPSSHVTEPGIVFVHRCR